MPGITGFDAKNRPKVGRLCGNCSGMGERCPLVDSVADPCRQTGGESLWSKTSRGHPDLQVLYLSGCTDDAVLQRGVLTSKVHFLQKPFALSQLASTIHGILDSACPSAHSGSTRDARHADRGQRRRILAR